jgi:hypothetical protein
MTINETTLNLIPSNTKSLKSAITPCCTLNLLAGILPPALPPIIAIGSGTRLTGIFIF